MPGLTSKTSSGNSPYQPEGTTANGPPSGNTLCGITYRKIAEEHTAGRNRPYNSQNADFGHVPSSGSEPQLKEPNPLEYSTNDEMRHYSRLLIFTRAILRKRPTMVLTTRRKGFAPIPPPPPPPPRRYWNCGHCNEGLMSLKYDSSCTNRNCGYRRDGYASAY